MNLVIKRKNLIKYLNYCNEVIDENQNNPIFSMLLINIKRDFIEFICSNNYINSKFILKNDFVLTGDEFNFLIKFKQFNSFISKMNSEYIEITKTPNKNIKIKNDKIECDLNIFEEEDYPVFNFESNDKKILDLKAKYFKEIKDLIIPNCSILNEQIKPINGINFEIIDDKLYIVSTDTFKVSRLSINTDISKIDGEFNIYSKTFEKIHHLISLTYNEDDYIPIIKKENNILIYTDILKLNIKLMSGNFPKTSKLFELEQHLNIIVDRNQLYEGIERAKTILISEKVPVINININNNKLLIEANSPESGYFSEEISIENIDNKNIDFKLNANYLSLILKLFKNNEIKIGIIANDKPIILHDNKNQEFKQIILPIKG